MRTSSQTGWKRSFALSADLTKRFHHRGAARGRRPRAFALSLSLLLLMPAAPAMGVEMPSELETWGRQVIPRSEDLQNIEAVRAGGGFNVGLRSDGTVVVWGANNHRQALVPEEITGATQIAAGSSHVMALLEGGTVFAWGDNRHGQASPPRDLQGVVAIAAGADHSLALREDGRVIAWGNDEAGQSSVPETLSDVTAIAAGDSHSVALLANGTVAAWGTGEAVEVPEDLPPLRAIEAGRNHNLGLTEEGRVVAWGDNSHDQAEVPRGLRDIAAIAAGGDHNLAMRRNGAVIAWGRDDDRQATRPVAVGEAVAIAAGDAHSVVLTEEEIFAWGSNEHAQSLLPGDLENAVQVSSQGQQGIVLRGDGSVLTWGERPAAERIPMPDNLEDIIEVAAGTNHFLALRADGTVAGWGDNRYRQIENVEQLENIITIAAGAYHSLALRDDGRITSWGSIIEAQQVPADLTDVVAIDAGPFHSIALTSAGTVRAWGNNFYGETTVPGNVDSAVAVAAGDFHSLALLEDGTVRGWGNDFFGQATPPEGLDSVVAIAAGSTHNLALRADGDVTAWGSDFYGQTDVRDDLANVVGISAGGSLSTAISGEPSPPQILAQTGPNTAEAGETIVLNVFAAGSPPLQYQWTRNDEPIPGAHRQSLTLEEVDARAEGEYSVMVANPIGNVVTDKFILSVNDPAIARHPASRAVRVGQDVLLRTEAAGTEPFSYQWKRDGEPIAGATDPVLEIARVQVEDTGSFTVEVSNEFGAAESRAAHVIAAPEFTVQPPEIVPANLGEPVSIRTEAAGSPPLNYQWEFQGEILPAATEAELTIPEVELEHAGSFRVTVWNDAGHTTSREISLIVAPQIVSHPQSQALELGSSAIFEARAIGSEPIRYRWRHDGEVIQEGDGSQLVVENIEPIDGGTYTVEAINPAGRVESQEARLIAPPGIASHPESKEVQAGETVRLSVEAIGTRPMRYQWERDREPIPGATSSTLALEDTRSEDSGSYRVRVRNEAGEEVSRSAILRLSPRIFSPPEPVIARPGERVAFEVEAEGSSPLSYQWMKNGSPIANANEPRLEIRAVDDRDAGSYTVMVSNAAGIQVSDPAGLTVSPDTARSEGNN